jgi:hypothetical protein
LKRTYVYHEDASTQTLGLWLNTEEALIQAWLCDLNVLNAAVGLIGHLDGLRSILCQCLLANRCTVLSRIQLWLLVEWLTEKAKPAMM